VFSIIFFGTILLGVALFLALSVRMARATASPPILQYLALFAAYGAAFLILVSEMFRVWSGMHSIATVGLLVVGVPWLLVQGVLLLRVREKSRYHQVAAALSFAFPVGLIGFGALFFLGASLAQ
jgi:hypothetical protein